MYQKELKFPFVIYADFETLAKKCGDPNKFQEHSPLSYGYVVVDQEGKIVHNEFDRGNKFARENFLKSLILKKIELMSILNTNQPCVMSEIEEFQFQSSNYSRICSKLLRSERVRDHCHISGKFRGAAHADCNLKYQVPKKIPEVFHNL